jgi:hypothetical protein
MSTTQESMLSWKANWINQQVKNSLHPESFWYEIADSVLESRVKMHNNPLVSIGKYMLEWPGAMVFLVERNNRGIELEKNGNIESAIIIYEISVADDFFGTHPYDRLRIFYNKKKWYKDAIRVCQAYLDLPNRPHGQDKSHFRQHLEKLLIKAKD